MKPIASLPSLREVVAVGFRYRWSILLASILPVMVGIGMPLLLTPKYEAQTRLLVRVGREFMPQSDVPGSMQFPQTTMREMVDTVTQILQSMDLIRDVLRDETVEKLYPQLAAGSPADERKPLEDAAAAALAGDLAVSPVRLTNVIEISLRNSDRQVAVEALRTVLTRSQERYVLAFSQRRSALLEAQIAENLQRLEEAQRQRAAYVAAHELFSLPEQRNLLVQQRARDSQELREAEMRKTSLEEQIRFLRAELARQPATITVQTTSHDSAVAEDAQRRLRELRAQEREQLNTLGPNHPTVRGTRAAIEATQQTLAQISARTTAVATGINPLITTLRTQLAATEAELAPLNGRIAALNAAREADEARLRRISTDEIELQALDRRIAEFESAVRELRQRQVDARFSEELDRAQVAGLSVIQQPLALDRPVSPKRTLFLVGGVIAGGLLGMLRLLLALTFGNRFLTAETIERMLGVPVLVALPPVRGWPRRRTVLAVAAEHAPQRIAAGT